MFEIKRIGPTGYHMVMAFRLPALSRTPSRRWKGEEIDLGRVNHVKCRDDRVE